MATEETKRQEIKKQETAKPQLALSKNNFVMMGACLLLIVVGFFLMAGSANEGDTFNYDVFSSTRTVVGPMIALAGFVLMAFAIIYKKKNNNVG